MNPEEVIHQFLKNKSNDQKLLLALSGGADSLCLFHCLLLLKKKFDLQFAVAHVNHGWREESEHEAFELKKIANSYQIPFYLKKLDPKEIIGNAEDYCRHERYAFFKELFDEYSFDALLLGHHADDQSEIILKRLLEGSHWSHQVGLKEEISQFGMKIYRPFLSINKKDIRLWLQQKQIVPFEDKTNEDTHFLRAKMRKEMIPWLSSNFGKEIVNPLLQIGKEASELKDYFDEKTACYLNQVMEGPLGIYLNLEEKGPTGVELKYLVRRFCERLGLCLGKPLIEAVFHFLEKNEANRVFKIGKHVIWVDRRKLFIPSFAYPLIKNELEINGEAEVNCNNGWLIQVKRIQAEKPIYATWKEGWKKEFKAVVPEGVYKLALVNPNTLYQTSSHSISRWWNEHKIPAFLRNQIPVLLEGDKVFYEFLTGTSRIQLVSPKNRWFEIKMAYSELNVV